MVFPRALFAWSFLERCCRCVRRIVDVALACVRACVRGEGKGIHGGVG